MEWRYLFNSIKLSNFLVEFVKFFLAVVGLIAGLARGLLQDKLERRTAYLDGTNLVEINVIESVPFIIELKVITVALYKT